MASGPKITVDCLCGTRLDVVRIGRAANGGRLLFSGQLRGTHRRASKATRSDGVVDFQAFLDAYSGPHVAEQAMQDGTALSYRCGKCGQGWSVQRRRLQDLAEQRLAGSGRRLTAGVDFGV